MSYRTQAQTDNTYMPEFGQQQYVPRYDFPRYNRGNNYNNNDNDYIDTITVDNDTHIILKKKIDSGLTSNVYEAVINDSDSQETYVVKKLNDDVSSDTRLMIADVKITNKCHCLPYVYILRPRWMLMEKIPYNNIHKLINSRTTVDIDCAINISISILQCLNELHKYNLDYIDISDFNTAIITGKKKPTEVRLFDHGGVSVMNNTTDIPFVNSRYRSLSVIMDNDMKFCSSKEDIITKNLQHDSTCSVLFMLLSWLIYPSWHTDVFRNGLEIWFNDGNKYPLLNELYSKRAIIDAAHNQNLDPSHRMYDSSEEKEYERSCKNLIKYRTFNFIISQLFENEPWAGIEALLYEKFDTYLNSLNEYFITLNTAKDQQDTPYIHNLCYASATIFLLVIWTTARIKTQPLYRNIDFVIGKLESLRTQPYVYDWDITYDENFKQLLYTYEDYTEIYAHNEYKQ